MSLLSSCLEDTSDQKLVTITQFDKVFVDSLTPIENRNYGGYYFKISGYANDSIRLKPGKAEDQYFWLYFKDSINFQRSIDYYGQFTTYITLDPYKATEGELKIEYRLMGF